MTATKTPILLTQLPPMRASHSALVRRTGAATGWNICRTGPGSGTSGAGARGGVGTGTGRSTTAGAGAVCGAGRGVGGAATGVACAQLTEARSSTNRRFSNVSRRLRR